MHYKFSFGKYRGKQIKDAPSSYLVWLKEQEWVKEKPDLESAVSLELSRRYALPDPEERKRVQKLFNEFCENFGKR